MKRIITLLSLIIFFVSAYASSNESFKYVVSYKWGLIHKDAGDVTITKKTKGDGYELRMVASTRPWADRIYKVRDTIVSVTQKEHYRPLSYSFIAHEKNKFKRDEIKYTYSGNHVKGAAHKYREKKNGEVYESDKTLEGELPVYDMLSIYFFLREIDYDNLKSGETVNATIFSGDKVEQLTVKSLGKEMVKLKDKSEREAWHIQFKFTSGGGKKSSDDINCWISTDSTRTPLLIIGNLPIGQIRVNYTGS